MFGVDAVFGSSGSLAVDLRGRFSYNSQPAVAMPIVPQPQTWKWSVFDRSDAEQAADMDALVRSGQVWQVRNAIDGQIEEPTRSRAQAGLDAGSQRAAIPSPAAADTFGRWIYYPWSGSLVHVLPPTEFRELRLDRNRHKITLPEQRRLARLTVGIVGLSAGNAIARTLCLEGVAERFKLADFDTLGLSNMNRLEAGVLELGLPKTVLLARRLAEINPYVELTLWEEGLKDDDIDRFLSDPRIDVLIDEADDMRMKLLVRERARASRITVLMETSDRGMLDVERFDLEPDRPILHGLTDGITSATLGTLSDDERLALVLAIVGAESISTRAAVSLVEMKQTISTWPQLASDVVLGGAIMTMAVRRLGLGHPLASGRRYVDVDDILDRPPADACAESHGSRDCATSTSAAATAGEPVVDSRISPIVQFMVEHAVLAPSGGNCQPWRFFADGMRLSVVHDRARSKNLLDADHCGSLLALGAAIQNICIAAASRGLATRIEPFPSGHNQTLVAQLSFAPGDPSSLAEDAARLDAVRRRTTNRRKGTPGALASDDAQALVDAAGAFGARVEMLGDPAAIAEVSAIVGECDRLRLLCKPLHAEMMAEIRWTTSDAHRTGNGLGLDTLELTNAQIAVFRLLARRDVPDMLRSLDAGRRLTQLSADTVRASSAVALLATSTHHPADVLRAGQAFQRLWLAATARDIALQPLGATVALFRMRRSEARSAFSASELERLDELEERFHRCFRAIDAGLGVMLFRVSRAAPPSARSTRLPLGAVLFAGPGEGDNVR